MKAVWSFWTKPLLADRAHGWFTHWNSEWHHWLAWGLSVYAAASHYPDTNLVTDDDGARILIDELKLPFRHVSTALNRFKHEDPRWWALGKLEAYRRQESAFVHVDADVFLWQPLSNALKRADVFAQNPEPIIPGASWYRPEELEQCVRRFPHTWLPAEWTAYARSGERAECCGIFGGRRVDFIQHYASAAIRLVTEPPNRHALESLVDKSAHMILVEQFLLSACYEYHCNRSGSPFRGIEMHYVFETIEDACRPERATQAGFTHLASSAKQDATVCADLEQRVQRDLPRFYERCLRYARAPICER